MISFLITVLKLLVILCIVATIHEFGHFLAAKLFKIGVNEFSVGYGPKIYQKKYKGTMYSLRWIPLGGYVMIEGEGEVSDKENSFEKKHPFKRIVVLAMGVIFNFILGFIVLMSVSAFVPVYTTQITEIAENSPLIEAGIQVGDKITKIEGKKVFFSNELVKTDYEGKDSLVVEYIHEGQKNYTVVNNVKKEIGYIGVAFKVQDNVATNEVDYTVSGSVAEKAGLEPNDKLLKVNGIDVNNATDIISLVQQSPNKNVEFIVKRAENNLTINIIPSVQARMDLGILNTKEENSNLYYSFLKSVKTIEQVIQSYAELFQGKVGINDVSSIVGIGVVVSQTSGILEYLNMLALISLAVGAANILPFVPLDGGKIVFVIYEWITKKKPNEKFEVVMSYIGWGLLLLLTIVVTFKDVINIF